MNKSMIEKVSICALLLCSIAVQAAPSASDYAAAPPIVSENSSAFVMVNLSVESPQQAEAFTDGEQVYAGNGTACPGRIRNVDIDNDTHNGANLSPAEYNRLSRQGAINTERNQDIGICYQEQETYIGYFDANKCYRYVTGNDAGNNSIQTPTSPKLSLAGNSLPSRFVPQRLADPGHKCPGNLFSGNFMNWSTMAAIDQFRYATTGGARLYDTVGPNAVTLLTRVHRDRFDFVDKLISAGGLTHTGQTVANTAQTFTNNPIDVTPFNESNLFVKGDRSRNNNGQAANTVEFYTIDTSRSGRRAQQLLGKYNVIVEVCNASVGLEENCQEYTDGSNTWYKPEGVFLENALNIRYALMTYSSKSGAVRSGDAIGGGVLRSQAKHIGLLEPLPNGGVIPNPKAEINALGQMVFDPDNLAGRSGGVNNSGFLNYINNFGLTRYKARDPIGELFYEGIRYFKNLGPTPEYSASLSNADKDNFPVILNWDDPITDACQVNYMVSVGDQNAWGDYNLPGTSIRGTSASLAAAEPSNPDRDIDVTALTDRVGDLENYTGNSSKLSTAIRGVDRIDNPVDRDSNNFYIAGLAYYANTQDIRSDLDGKQSIRTFMVDTQQFNRTPEQGRDNQLWLAAKYGGFIDTNGDDDPNDRTPRAQTPEWDANNDGNPDTFTLASQPDNLIAGLRSALGEISDSVNAGSALGAVSNSSTGETLLVQALYQPKLTANDGRTIEWGGVVQSLFLDSFGRYREDAPVNADGSGDGKITDDDPVIEFTNNRVTGTSTASRFHALGQFTERLPFDTGIAPEDLNPVWNVRDQLATLSDLENNRDYITPVGAGSGKGRYIFTHIDANNDGIVGDAEVIPFIASNFNAGINSAYIGLGQNSTASAQEVVNYVRGVESTKFRSRTLDFNDVGQKQRWLLGDVISSSPVIDAGSNSGPRYDNVYRDDSFSAYLTRYSNARNMVYFGANDGMIRGVNAGFFDRATNGYVTSLTPELNEKYHPLGAEMWAYVPQSVLPHLQWLKDRDYQHNYYVDGIPHVYTVNIFGNQNAKTYPNGWGKILVVGTGFGGGKFDIDTDGDGNTDVSTTPSFVVLDITDPEVPPKLLAEITHPNLGFTTSRPALAFFREPQASGSYITPTRNEWYLVMGSGPTGRNQAARSEAVTQGVSDQTAKVFVYDLIKKELVNFGSGNASKPFRNLGSQRDGFIGAVTAVDWDRTDGYGTDAIYFGTVRGSINAPSGDIFRLTPGVGGKISSPTVRKLLVQNRSNNQLGEPVQGVPKVVERLGERWVYFGTGRFFGDRDAKALPQMGMYAVKEFPTIRGQNYLRSTSRLSQLVNVSDLSTEFDANNPSGDLITDNGVRLTVGNSSFPAPAAVDENEPVSIENLTAQVTERRGWYSQFESAGDRQIGRIDSLNDSLFYTVYSPSGDQCNVLGQTNIFGVNYKTGISPAFSILGDTDVNGTVTVAAPDRFLTAGLVKDVTLLGDIALQPTIRVDSVTNLGPDNLPIITPTNGNGGANTSGGGSTTPNAPPGSGGGAGSPSGTPSTPAPNPSSGFICGPGFPISATTASGAPTTIPARNCRRLSGRLQWREVPLPW